MRSANKHFLNEALQWAFVGLSLFLGIYFFDDIKAFVLEDVGQTPGPTESRAKVESKPRLGFSGQVRLKADPRGHFIFEGKVDGRPVTFVADTGASTIALTYEDARRVGLFPQNLDFSVRVSTANGMARVAPVVLSSVRVGSIKLRDVPAVVAEEGAQKINLLGMSFLGRLESFNMSGNELVLIE